MNIKAKTVIVINGKGESGKDTYVKIISEYFYVRNVSSIDPIKELAFTLGWDGVKNDRGRAFLVDLKKARADYNDFPTTYLTEEVDEFLLSNEEYMFCHIREGVEIDKFKEANDSKDIIIKTLLVRRDAIDKSFGNASDDNVEDYKYNWYFDNNGLLDELPKRVLDDFLEHIKL